MGALAELDVLVVDCQATAAAPRGRLLEIGWTRVPSTRTPARARLIRLPHGERIPPGVSRITGISDAMMRQGIDARTAWSELLGDAASVGQQPAPTVVHFARFETPFLQSLSGGARPLDIVCTHDIARRLLPDLPRCSLRAVAGYFGRAVGAPRRSVDHVEATEFVWQQMIALLDRAGVSTWEELKAWLASPAGVPRVSRRGWPMPRETRLSLPDAPGLYRMLRSSGDVLYVGKAASLRARVNSYFRKQHGVPERMLEMLSQARRLSFEVTPTALEAALLEPDEIKHHRPPYNIALTTDDRQLWFAPPDLSERSPHATARCCVGPFPSGETLDQFVALAHANAAALGIDRWNPDQALFRAGYDRFAACHPELTLESIGPCARLLRLGTRLWHEGRRDRDDDGERGDRFLPLFAASVEHVQASLERLALRAALARRRARWLTRLFDASLVWLEPGRDDARLIVIDNGDIITRASVEGGTSPPLPPGHSRSVADRHAAFTIARLDRLRVLTTELKRLSAENAAVALRLGDGPTLTGPRLACALSWL